MYRETQLALRAVIGIWGFEQFLAAKANLIVRREETAAMRSQLNTAKLLDGKPTLMRLQVVGGAGKSGHQQQAERRAGRKEPGRADCESALIVIGLEGREPARPVAFD